MSDMPDSTVSALRQRDAAEDRAQSKYEAYGERARESIVDELMRGRKVGGAVLYDILDGPDLLDTANIVAIVINQPGVRDDILDHLEKDCRELCKDWLDTVAGQDAVDDLVNEMDEEARNDV